MTTYNIDWQSGGSEGIPGKTDITLPPKTADSTSTSVTLTGRGLSNWGEIQQENFIRLMENFASENEPNAPTVGQLWFNADECILYMCIDETNTTISGEPRYFPSGSGPWVQVYPASEIAANVEEYNDLANRINKVLGAPQTSGANPDPADNEYGWGQTGFVPDLTAQGDGTWVDPTDVTTSYNLLPIFSSRNAAAYPGGATFARAFDNTAWCDLIAALYKAARVVYASISGIVPQRGFIRDARGRKAGDPSNDVTLSTTFTTSLAWTRVGTTATITHTAHGLASLANIEIVATSDAAAIPAGVYSITVLTPNTYTITCLNAGATSGTISIYTYGIPPTNYLRAGWGNRGITAKIEQWDDINTAVDLLEAGRFHFPVINMEEDLLATATLPEWQTAEVVDGTAGKRVVTFTAAWASQTLARQFFNTGGYLKFNMASDDDTIYAGGDQSWQDFLSTEVDGLVFDYRGVGFKQAPPSPYVDYDPGTAPADGHGFYDLLSYFNASDFALKKIFTNGRSVGSAYASAVGVEIEARITAVTPTLTLELKVTFLEDGTHTIGSVGDALVVELTSVKKDNVNMNATAPVHATATVTNDTGALSAWVIT